MALLEIKLFPDPVLRVECPEIEQFDAELKKLAGDMVETMYAAPGIGLAAPQVGVELRLAVVDLSVGEEPGNAHVLINPRLLATDGEDTDLEGCLSMPGITEKVKRPESIRVEACDLSGNLRSFEADGLLARAIQHEIDHLDGVLFTDHLTGLRRERARRWMKKVDRELRRFPE